MLGTGCFLGGVLFIYLILPNLLYRKKLVLDQEDIVFTFDDGPTPKVTEEVLEILEKHHLYGIFFVLGKKAQAHPEIIQKIQAKGHKIGLHGYEHFLGAKKFPWTCWKDMKKGMESLEALGIEVKDYRPAHGLYTLTHLLFAWKYKLKLWHWWSLFGDWEKISTQNLVERMKKEKGPGRVFVLHDGCEGTAWVHACENMPKALALFLEESLEASGRKGK